MSIGPGKYDDLCTYVREQAKAQGAIILVLGGEQGEGFCCQADLAVTAALPQILRHIADTMQADLERDVLNLMEAPPP